MYVFSSTQVARLSWYLLEWGVGRGQVQASTYSVDIYAYDGEGDTDWVRDGSGNLLPNVRRVCTLTADLSGLRGCLTLQKGSEGQDFWKVSTALKARMTWYEGVSISQFHP